MSAPTWRLAALPQNRSQHFLPTLLLTTAKNGGITLLPSFSAFAQPMMSLRGRARGGCTMQFGLPDDVLPRLTELLSSNVKVKTITLYGSRAKGNYRLGSDIDLCLDADGLSLPKQFVLENRVDDLLLPWKGGYRCAAEDN